MILPRIAARAFNEPLMIDVRKAAAILHGLGGRFVEGGVEFDGVAPVEHKAFAQGRPSMGRIGDRLGRSYDRTGNLPFDVIEGAAIIPIEGTLVHKGAFVGSESGETSYQGLQTQVKRAMQSDIVCGAVFEVDSFGGEVAGAFETANMIAELSAKKPTIAILTDFALSAGYLMASAARQIVMPETGRAGSIGVITLHVDYSKALKDKGVKVSIIAAGEHKADGNPFEPLPDAVRSGMQASVDRTRDLFATAVGNYRGNRFGKDAALATEAADFGADEAMSIGMVDGVGDANAMYDEFISGLNSRP